jgi:predicted nucleotidyltransferase
MINQQSIEKAAAVLRQVAKPEKIILFGSHAREEARVDSDLDILVIEKEVGDRIAEIARLNRALGPLRLPVDLILVSQEMFDYWSDTPGNVYYRARKEGKIIYEKS